VSQEDLALKEEFVVVTTSVAPASQSLKAIQVQLTLETGELGELEVLRKQFHKLLWLVDHKAASMGLPRYDMIVAICLHIFQHIMKPQGERSSNSTTCWVLFLVVSTIVVRVVMVVVLDSDVSVARFALCHGLGFKDAHIEGLPVEFTLDCDSVQKRSIDGFAGSSIDGSSGAGDAHCYSICLETEEE
jgi:hypothetical protein